jgi:AcrR family transcriptional regulator
MTSRRRRPSSSSGHSRHESKELTRRALLRSALKLLSQRSFDAISLREVTREAGVSPTAFYRHFDDMDELGLVLVDESFGTLRDVLRQARAGPGIAGNAIQGSIEVLVEHVAEHETHMRFIARERYGGVGRLRRAIARELQLFADELAVDLARFPFVRDWGMDDRKVLADLLTETMVALSSALVDARPEDHAALIARAEQQVRLIALGVPNWHRTGATGARASTAPVHPLPSPPGVAL